MADVEYRAKYDLYFFKAALSTGVCALLMRACAKPFAATFPAKLTLPTAFNKLSNPVIISDEYLEVHDKTSLK